MSNADILIAQIQWNPHIFTLLLILSQTVEHKIMEKQPELDSTIPLILLCKQIVLTFKNSPI